MSIKAFLKILGLSALTCSVPSLFVFLGCLLFCTFLKSLGVSVISFGIFWLIGSLINVWYNYKAQAVYLKELGDFAKKSIDQSLPLSCSYCKINNIIRIDFDNPRLTFKCESCKNENLVIVDVKTAQITGDIDQTQKIR